MQTFSQLFLLLGSLNMMLAVIIGAFGAHGLKSHLSADLMAVYQTANEYHFYHALGLIFVGLIAIHFPVSIWLKVSGWIMLAGIILFSGSLYLLAISGMKWLGMITPFGGLLFIFSWLALCISILKQ